MAQRLPVYHELSNYYDLHATEEELMPETSLHEVLLGYLKEVLLWLFVGQRCAVYRNLNMLVDAHPEAYALAPDLAVLKGVDWQMLSSWHIGSMGPAPQMVFELASKETWRRDLHEKPRLYARMGIKEYFAYDPHEPMLPASQGMRLHGWRLNKTGQEMHKLLWRTDGSLWSPQLESFLVPDGPALHLYDWEGNLRLTRAEAEAERADVEAEAKQVALRRVEAEADGKRAALRQAAVEARRADVEAEAKQVALRRADVEAEAKQVALRRADAEARRADVEAEAKQAALRRADAEARRADVEAEAKQAALRQAEVEAKRADAEAEAKQAALRQIEALVEKLRSLGIDPNQL